MQNQWEIYDYAMRWSNRVDDTTRKVNQGKRPMGAVTNGQIKSNVLPENGQWVNDTAYPVVIRPRHCTRPGEQAREDARPRGAVY